MIALTELNFLPTNNFFLCMKITKVPNKKKTNGKIENHEHTYNIIIHRSPKLAIFFVFRKKKR